MQKWEIQLNLLYLPKLDVYSGKNARQILFKNKNLNKFDYYSNNHIICIIYAKFENIDLFPFSSENLQITKNTNVF